MCLLTPVSILEETVLIKSLGKTPNASSRESEVECFG